MGEAKEEEGDVLSSFPHVLPYICDALRLTDQNIAFCVIFYMLVLTEML